MGPSPCMLALPLLPHVGLEECFPSFTWGSMSQQSPQRGNMLATQQISGCDLRARLRTPLWNGLGPSPGVGTLSISTSVMYVHVWATAAGRRRAGPIALEVSGRRWRDGAGPFLACRSWDLDLQNGGRAHAGTSRRAACHWLSDGAYHFDTPMRDRGCWITGACQSKGSR